MRAITDDYIEVLRLTNLYALSLDTRDWNGLRSVFIDDAVMEFHGLGKRQGIDNIVAVCASALEPLHTSQHLIGTQDATITGDQATSISYFQAQHVVNSETGPTNYTVAGTYRDQLKRTSDGWRIVYRIQEVTWTDGDPEVLSANS